MHIELIDVTKDNWKIICELTPGKDSDKFVASNAYSIVQASYQNEFTVKGIACDGCIIGFTMFGYNEDFKGYELCRYMIDEKYQGKGYGKYALKVILDEMYTRYNCDEILLRVALTNDRGLHLYKNNGFLPTGKHVPFTQNGETVIEEIYKLTL